MQRLAQIGTTLTYKAEVEALGLEEYILNGTLPFFPHPPFPLLLQF